jgi:hypothetical protein
MGPGDVATVPSGPASRSPVPSVRYRRGRISDTPRLIRLYLGLSEDARHGFHPFPFNRASLWFLYPTLLTISRLGRPMMRRFPRLIVVLVVAELEGTEGFVGYGTLRGETPKGEPPQVRFGFVVRDGFRGHRIGIGLLRRLSEEGLVLGIRVGVGMVFRRDARAIKAIQGFGFALRESPRRDPQAPEEDNFETWIELEKAVRPSAAPPPAGAAHS